MRKHARQDLLSAQLCVRLPSAAPMFAELRRDEPALPMRAWKLLPHFRGVTPSGSLQIASQWICYAPVRHVREHNRALHSRESPRRLYRWLAA
jgi:hypothetical protein